MQSIVYVGLDVHKESITVCSYTIEADKLQYAQKLPSDYKQVLKYIEHIKRQYSNFDSNPNCLSLKKSLMPDIFQFCQSGLNLKLLYPNATECICGYEAGCMGYIVKRKIRHSI